MLIQCTKKLLDALKIKPEAVVEYDPLFSWHANLMTVNRRKVVVLVNDKNRYAVALYGLKAKDFKMLNEIILQAIRKTLQAEGIDEEIIEKFVNHSPDVIFTKTKDRTSVARMNKSCDNVYFYGENADTESIFNSEWNVRMSRFLVGDGKNSYFHPNEEMYKDLEEFAGRPIFHSQAVQLKVKLLLEKHHVWRRLVVPVNMTFAKLHKVLQGAFGWQDYHLHQFYIFDGDKPIVNLVCDEEAFSYPHKLEMKLDTGVRLSEYIPLCKRIKYVYDFGDNWEHEVEVESVIENYDKNYPICLAGEGNTPPEDVGGEGGFEEFLEIMADPTHPEHENTVSRGKGQGFREFDMNRVNWEIKRVL